MELLAAKNQRKQETQQAKDSNMNYSPALGQNPHSLFPEFPVPSGLFQVLKPWLS